MKGCNVTELPGFTIFATLFQSESYGNRMVKAGKGGALVQKSGDFIIVSGTVVLIRFITFKQKES